MTSWGGRVRVYLAVALLTWGAIAVIRPLPDRRALEALIAGDSAPALVERADSLAEGETLGRLLSRTGLSAADAHDALEAAPGFDARRAPAGMRVTLSGPTDSLATQVVLHLDVDRLLRLTRTDTGWIAVEERVPWVTDTVVVVGSIRSSLSAAFQDGALAFPGPSRPELAWDVADVFEYRIDMSRDLREGDPFAVVVERLRGPQGAVRSGRILAAEYGDGPQRIRAVRLDGSGSAQARYFDQAGRSMQSLFLRAPLEFRRISSAFGMRRHPILGVWRRHAGTDYAASAGTPVRAVGDGVVVAAGRRGGYGNVVDVRHANGFVSRYGHLRGFARGVRRGVRVALGQTIGFVGTTGLASAPHLHFEVLVQGRQRDPRLALGRQSGRALSDAERPEFERAKARWLALMDSVRVAAAGASP